MKRASIVVDGVLHRQRFVESLGRCISCGVPAGRIDAALAHHRFDGIARYQVNQRECRIVMPMNVGITHAYAAQNKAEHGSSLWS